MRTPDPSRFGVAVTGTGRESSSAPTEASVPPPTGSAGTPARVTGRFPGGPPRIVLERVLSKGKEQFILDPPITYEATVPGRDGVVQIVVPRAGSGFLTDLTSVPSWFTWLVPKSGEHLPAALIHDGLVPGRDGRQTYDTIPDGITIDRIDADRIFRDAMFDSEVGLIRSYLVWAAVSLASLVLGARSSWKPYVLWYYRALAVVTIGIIVVLGYAATIDLLDSSWPAFDVPWMYEGGLAAELYTGFAGAVVLPLLLAIPWGRYYPVAAIAGVAVATLLHVTVAVGIVALAYQAAERVLQRGEGSRSADRAAWALVALVVVACAASVAGVWLS